MTTPGCPIVGIGASAGGLDALKTLFENLPVDSGAAFVVIQHLDPKHESLTAEILARCTAMPTLQISNGMPAAANHVYVIPPNAYLTLQGHTFELGEPVLLHGLRMPIDTFFWSLAEQHTARAIAVVLSGTGSDGTLGLRAIKGHDGLTMAQSPDTAQYDGMPRSAIATGLVDVVCPVKSLAGRLANYLQHPYINGVKTNATDAPAAADDSQLHAILAVLQASTGHDFRSYKPATLRCRIARRMGLHLLQSLDDYVVFLRQHADEVLLLFNDLLIGVTAFFRDPDAWQALDTDVIRPLLERKPTDEPIRVWVPGCASGEEAYSIAILLIERLAAAGKHCPIQIFATDIDAAALATARAGIYPENIAAQLTENRLQRYFDKEDHSYRVKQALRDTLTFAGQDMLSDPPFSNLDLISCRNLLIYLNTDVQRKTLAIFHFALRDAACLFLGLSETANQQEQLFEPLAKKWRIYRRLAVAHVFITDYPVGSMSAHGASAGTPPSVTDPAERIRLSEVAQRHLLHDFAPAAVLVNRRHQVLNFSGPTARYLQQPSGAPTQDVLSLAQPELRPKLRAALRHAVDARGRITLDDAHVMRDKHRVAVKITVKPLAVPRLADSVYLITFEDDIVAPAAQPAPKKAVAAGSEQEVTRQLENELSTLREELQSNIEDQQSSNEELQAASEEVMSINEELQSSNEELETSKEELQSMNEELTTVNSQLSDSVDSLTANNNDLANLLSSTDIATLFLDTEFRIGRFTPATQRLFRLLNTDIGRPLADIRPKFSSDDLLIDARNVLDKLVPLEREVYSDDSACYLRRIVPYRTGDNRITGVVITFVDISQRQQAEADAQRLASVVRDSNDAITLQDLQGKIIAWNLGAERIYGWSEQAALGMPFNNMIPVQELQTNQHLFERVIAGEQLAPFETQRISKNGHQLSVSVTLTPLRDPAGDVSAIASTERDVTVQKQAETDARSSKALVDSAYAAKSRLLSTASHDLRQPLQSLTLLNASLLDTVSDADAQEMLAMQGESLAGMGHLLNSLLDISGLDSDSLGTALSNVALQPILQRLHANFEPTAHDKALRMNIETSDASVYTDAGLLTQLLQNLIANAVRYTQRGFVQVKCERVDKCVKIAVTDSGVGIAADQLSKIFEEFHQVDRDPQQRYAGLGLGLAIVKRIADLLETKIDVQSELGRGSTFSLMLPAGEQQAAQCAEQEQLPDKPIGGEAAILLIDDDPAVLKATRIFVEKGSEIKVTTAASAPQAYKLLQHLRPDLIITDYYLGEGDTGIDIIRAARQQAGKTIPAILISGYTTSALQQIYEENVHVLAKPIEAKKLSLLIWRLLT